MKIYRLIPDRRDFDLQRFRKGAPLAEVSNGCVRIRKLNLRFHGLHYARSVCVDGIRQYAKIESALPDGTEVRVWIDENDFFVCAKSDEWLAEENAKHALHEKRADEEHAVFMAREKAKQAEAEAFNALLQVPVRWHPGVKDTTEEVSKGRAGQAADIRPPAIHVLLDDALEEPRLTRSAGSFLCSRDGRGKRWEAEPFEATVTKVTCKKCLALTKRWRTD